MGEAGFALEAVLAVLLGATLLYAIRLHRALDRLRQDRAALDTTVRAFDEGVRAARSALHQASDHLSGPLTAAAALRDDLAFLSDRGNDLADRLDGLVRTARGLAQAGPAAAAEGVRSQAERDLLLALQARP